MPFLFAILLHCTGTQQALISKQTLRKSEFQEVLLISSLSDSNTAIITYIHNVYMSSVFLNIGILEYRKESSLVHHYSPALH